MLNPFSTKHSTTFNPIPIQDIHYSWIKVMPHGELIEKLRKTPSSLPALTDFVQQYIPINDAYKENTAGVFTLLEESTSKKLYTVVLKAGTTQFSQKIRQFIKKQDVTQLKKILGDKLYSYSLSEVPEVHPSLDKIVLDSFSIDRDPLANIINAGYRSLRIAFTDLPESYIYKLPKPWDISFNKRMSSDTLSKSERALHKDLILKLLESS